MSVNMLEVRARKELEAGIKGLAVTHYDQNLYNARTRDAIVKDIAVIRDELIDKYQVSLPAVALYVGEYGRVLKIKFVIPSLLKGPGCVGWMKEPEGGGIAELKVENLGGPRN
jgi:hypothetical protein